MSEKIRQLVVGLGNPGRRYQDNRHNIGFLVIDELLRRRELEFSVHNSSFLATGETFGSEQPVFLKPLTYMNLSGEALVLWAGKNDEVLSGCREVEDVDEEEAVLNPIDPVRPFVICDDLALPLGAVRLRGRGSSGGQNGIQSIIESIGGEEFPRLRLGIAPADGAVDPEFWPDYVLADFEPEEYDAVREVVAHAADTVEFWLENGLEQTASRFNRRRAPVEPESED